jgi:4-amino-4-deoxy-L-arabinose transferase-like glycosyltransferase
MLARIKSFFDPPVFIPDRNDANPNRNSALHAPARIFWVALAVRVLYITLAHTYRIRPAEDHFQFGWEAGRIARALVTGYGYSDPFANAYLAHTGPTAWLPPLYPLLMAAIFRVFGVFTHASAWVLFTVNSIFSAATALAVWEIAARCLSRRVALWSAWIWALYPAAMQYAVRWPWEMSITTCLFAFTLVLALRLRGIGGLEPATRNPQPATSWLLFGLLWGLIALSNSTLLIFLPVCVLWMLIPSLRAPTHRAPALRNAALAALILLACIAPWTLRNWRVFHTFIPLRGNLGAENYMGNGPGSNGLLMEYDHPFQSPEQLRLYASLGEVRYVALRGALARDYIAAHPAHFAADVARRIYFFWISVPHPSDDAWYVEAGRILNFAFLSIAGLMGLALALHRRVPAAGLFAWAFLLLPIPYYLITVHARFRHPLEPLICILIVYLFQSAQPTPYQSAPSHPATHP